jgi:hypothetical protein
MSATTNWKDLLPPCGPREEYKSTVNFGNKAIDIVAWPMYQTNFTDAEGESIRANLAFATAIMSRVAEISGSEILPTYLSKFELYGTTSWLGKYDPKSRRAIVDTRFTVSKPQRFFPIFTHELGHPLVRRLSFRAGDGSSFVDLDEELLANRAGIELLGLGNYLLAMNMPLTDAKGFTDGFQSTGVFRARIEEAIAFNGDLKVLPFEVSRKDQKDISTIIRKEYEKRN